MRYIIMADGKGTRWNNYRGIRKEQIVIGHQSLLERTCDLIRAGEPNAEIYVTSHDTALAISGVTRHEPQNNHLEIDRFTWELIAPDVCFLYGDVYYSKSAMETIQQTKTDAVLFFGSKKKIFAVKVADEQLFRQHILSVRNQFLAGSITECIGWEVYHAAFHMPLVSREIGEGYVLIDDETQDYNCPQDLLDYEQHHMQTAEDTLPAK